MIITLYAHRQVKMHIHMLTYVCVFGVVLCSHCACVLLSQNLPYWFIQAAQTNTKNVFCLWYFSCLLLPIRIVLWACYLLFFQS